MSRALATAVFAVLACSACELREITLATPDDVVIAEVVLRSGSSVQTAYLHRTAGTGAARVPGAVIEVTEDETGRSFTMQMAPDSLCLDPAPMPESGTGTCYSAESAYPLVLAGRSYALRIELEEGGVLTGSTMVPDSFRIVTPAIPACVMREDSVLDLIWTRSAGSSVYLTEARMIGLRQALRRRGVEVPGEAPVELLGLSITATDTTLAFPSELGLFDRFDDDLHPILLALRDGVPPDVTSLVSVSAADRNYVNWVRGGNFNPSGLVRISSLRGDGAGVFGALTTEHVDIRTGQSGSGMPPCS